MSEPTPDGPNVTYVLDPTAHLAETPAALHARVLAAIPVETAGIAGDWNRDIQADIAGALLDIAERHKPTDPEADGGLNFGEVDVACSFCGGGLDWPDPWPCPDFRSCARAVGVEIPQ